MIYEIATSKKVSKFLRTCEKHIRESFFEKSKIFAQDPFSAWKVLDIDTLEGEKNMYRLRI